MEWPTLAALSALTAEEIRAAALSFPECTSCTDEWHPRRVGYLSDEALEALADIIVALEALGDFPTQLHGLLVKLIPKPGSSDTRPIGLFKGLVRVWGRARKKHIAACMGSEAAHGDTNNMLAGRHTLDAVWRAQMRAFLGHARGQHSIEIMWDMLKFCEAAWWNRIGCSMCS